MPKQLVRNETDLFLNEGQGSLSYLPDRLIGTPESDFIRSISFDPLLTGAREPILPIRIAITDTKGKRIEFTMLINPLNLNHGKTNSVSSVYTRRGFVTQLWGPNQDVLTSTGRTAVFMAGSAGVTTFYRKQSFAYLNFMAFVNAFKNNGYQIFDPTMSREAVQLANSRVIKLINGVEISYDMDVFTGHFNTFTLDEAAENPFIFDYNFEFIISSLNENFSEVRGHFVPIPKRNEEPELESSVLLDDVLGYGPKTAIRRSRPRNEISIYSLWKKKTGLDWDQAIRRDFTDGSPKQNLQLRGQLLAGQVRI